MIVHQTYPVLRIEDAREALEFWCETAGFTKDWEHRFEPGFPLYVQVSRGGLVLHLSQHQGDAPPGGLVFVRLEGLAAFCAELQQAGLAVAIRDQDWGQEMELRDPFGNRIRFCETPPAG